MFLDILWKTHLLEINVITAFLEGPPFVDFSYLRALNSLFFEYLFGIAMIQSSNILKAYYPGA